MPSEPHLTIPPAARVLLVRLTALGDVLLALPLAQALLAHGVKLTWIIAPQNLPLVAHLADRVEFYPLDGPRRLGDFARVRHDFSARRFDVLLAAQAKARINLIYPLLHADIKLGFDGRRARDLQGVFVNARIARADEHLADGMLAFARALGIEADGRFDAPPVPNDSAQWCAGRLGGQPYLLLNVCSSKAERDWPLERQIEFATRLHEAWPGLLVVAGGPSRREREWAARIAAAHPQSVDLAGQTTLPQLLALCAGARVLVSPDSGPVHIATAYGVPVVGLYAVARAALAGPWRAARFCVDRYDEAVRRCLGKDPASVDWHARVHDDRAMALIDVDAVLEQVRRALA